MAQGVGVEMTDAQRRYIAVEAGIGAAINAVLSGVFVVLVFRGPAPITAAGLAFDAIPHTFMVSLMSAVVPTLLTRRRLAAGAVQPLPSLGWRLPASVMVRGVAIALVVTLVLASLQALVLRALVGQGAAFAPVLAMKVLYGALLGAAISAFAVRVALGEPVRAAKEVA